MEQGERKRSEKRVAGRKGNKMANAVSNEKETRYGVVAETKGN